MLKLRYANKYPTKYKFQQLPMNTTTLKTLREGKWRKSRWAHFQGQKKGWLCLEAWYWEDMQAT